MRVVVLCPHFAPDTAPTGEVMTGIVDELARLGATVHVVTALPWYRKHSVEEGWGGRLFRREKTEFGSVIRVHPFPGRDKRSLVRRAFGFAVFSVVSGLAALFAGGIHRRPAAILAMSPPLTLGPTGWVVGLVRRAPLVFNIQDVFPDAAVKTGAITNRTVIALASRLERFSYARSRAVVALSDDLATNIAAKLAPSKRDRVRVIPNFVDTERIAPSDRITAYRRELSLGDGPVVMYAGNVGFSQSLGLVLAAARRMPGVLFVVNGEGSARAELEREASDLPNVRFADYQPRERLAEVLASGDIHLVPLRAGLGTVSVPSKTYSILAAGRPVLAAVDAGTEVPRILAASGAGVVVPPDDPEAFVEALERMLADRRSTDEMGRAGRRWVEENVSPGAVGRAYADLIGQVSRVPIASTPRGDRII